ncbi:uncharacterized protein METZ01_LOCUS34535 [marine metagenome]|uniref:Uncharacterized protein n=1 Tax=marine metagenome TaxID=408172 RepID=A0A381QQR2_9ZZZZ
MGFCEEKNQFFDCFFLPSPRRRFLIVGSRIANHHLWILH